MTFRSRLASNITTYITSKYCPKTLYDSDAAQNRWNDDSTNQSALQKDFFNSCAITNTKNQNGYYYYKGGTTLTGRLLTIFGTGVQASPRTAKRLLINNSTVLYVTGADVQIDSDIEYGTTGTNPSLVIIVQKDNQGN